MNNIKVEIQVIIRKNIYNFAEINIFSGVFSLKMGEISTINRIL